MSGVPNWAFREPSTKRTAEWTTLCGWMTTSIASSPTSYSQRASTTSRPLFASVAESIVIFAPIDQVGWRRACCGVTADRSAGPSRNGPPEAVRIERRDPRHRLADEALPDRRVLGIDRAEPGERAGEAGRRDRSRARSAARARASGMTRWPPATSVSLLAVATTLPAASAARTGRRLTMPPVATTTRSTSSRVAISARRRAVGAGDGDPGAEPRGLLRQQTSDWLRRPARRPRNASGWAARTSSACVPIEPVEPRTRDPQSRARLSGTRRGHRAPATGAANRNESTRSRTPPWPGISVPESLAPAARLSIDSARSPAWAASATSGPRISAGRGRLAEPDEDDGADDGRGDDPADQPRVRLRRRDVGQELALPEALADEVGAGVEGPDREDEQHDPAAIRAERRRAARQRQAGASWPSRRMNPSSDA